MISSNDFKAIRSFIKSLAKERDNLIESCMELSFYSSSNSYFDCLKLSPLERDIAKKIIERKIEIEDKKFELLLKSKSLNFK